jgi:HAD superfamily phosphoserine phosphatase-like hydrolase
MSLLEPGPLRTRAPQGRRVVERFLFDLDGTLTRAEIVPEIARAFGRDDEVANLARRTQAGLVPFASSLRRRVELLADVPVDEVRRVVAGIELDPHIAAFVAANRERCTVVTGHLDVWVSDLVERLGVPCRSSVAEVTAGRVTGVRTILAKQDITREFAGTLCAIGDGVSDLALMAGAELAVAYGGVHEPAPALFDVATHVVYDPHRLCALLSGW